MEPSTPPSIPLSGLLALPAELRLDIWAYVLADGPPEKWLLSIKSGSSTPWSANPRSLKPLNPNKPSFLVPKKFSTRLQRPRGTRINANLLATCQMVYFEALPILYQSVVFSVHDVTGAGIFPAFLSQMSAFAKAHIHYVTLHPIQPMGNGPSEQAQAAWTRTCTQVAELGESVKQVEVAGLSPNAGFEKATMRMMYPLIQIKAPKVFTSSSLNGSAARLEALYREAEIELESKPLRDALSAIAIEWCERRREQEDVLRSGAAALTARLRRRSATFGSAFKLVVREGVGMNTQDEGSQSTDDTGENTATNASPSYEDPPPFTEIAEGESTNAESAPRMDAGSWLDLDGDSTDSGPDDEDTDQPVNPASHQSDAASLRTLSTTSSKRQGEIA